MVFSWFPGMDAWRGRGGDGSAFVEFFLLEVTNSVFLAFRVTHENGLWPFSEEQ